MKRSFALAALLMLAPCASSQPVVQAQQATADRLVLKVYQVADLLLPTPNYPYQPANLPTTAGTTSYRNVGGQGVGGGMGGVGGGGSGGGGFFQVPAEKDIHRSREAGGQAGGGAPEGLGGATATDFDSLIELITTMVAPTTWDEVGGPGSIAPFATNFSLVISQTEENHRAIQHLLTEIRAQGGAVRNVTVAARWLLLDDAQRSQLAPEESGKAALVLDRAALKELAADATRHQGRVTCHSGQTVHIVSGTRHTVVTSAIPVVGSGIGYQPVVAYPNAGVLLQITPFLLPGGQTASLDVQSSVTSWQAPEPLSVTAGDSELSIDRVHLTANQLATTVRIPVGKPVLVGGLTPSDADPPQKALYLVVELTVDDAEPTPPARAK